MNSDFFVRARKRFFNLMEDNSIAVFFSGHFLRDTNDQLAHPFSVDRNFYYLTGLDRDGFQLIFWKLGDQELVQLFIPPVDEHYERWQAKMVRQSEATAISGIDQVLYNYQLDSEFSKKIFAPTVCENLYLFTNIADLHEPLTPTQAFAKKVSTQYPSLKICNSLPLMVEIGRAHV